LRMDRLDGGGRLRPDRPRLAVGLVEEKANALALLKVKRHVTEPYGSPDWCSMGIDGDCVQESNEWTRLIEGFLRSLSRMGGAVTRMSPAMFTCPRPRSSAGSTLCVPAVHSVASPRSSTPRRSAGGRRR